MQKILIFSGTTEGNQIAEALSKYPVKMYLSVATEYGRTCAGNYQNMEVVSGKMELAEMERFICGKQIDAVIDATHPFARIVTENVRKACESTKTEYFRCLREKQKEFDGYVSGILETDTVGEAAKYLKDTEGNILVTTGSRDLEEYTQIPGYRERCYVRVLSTKEAVEKAVSLGFEGKHLIAMQGPFSKEMNVAMLHHTNASYFVTKESGKAGGFEEKLKAAEETGAKLIVICRPQESGMSVEQVLQKIGAVLRGDV